jgi:hypothetical protein
MMAKKPSNEGILYQGTCPKMGELPPASHPQIHIGHSWMRSQVPGWMDIELRGKLTKLIWQKSASKSGANHPVLLT